MRFYNIAVGLTLLFVTVASKAQNFGVGEIVANGSGCPNASISWGMDDDGLFVRTDQFVAEVVRGGASVDLKSCTLAIPLQIPEGVQLVLPRAELEVHTKLSRKAQALVKTEVFVAGASGRVVNKKLKGPIHANLTVETPTAQLVSACGKDLILRANISALVEAKSKSASGVVAISEIHPLAGLKFRDCR